MSVKDGFSRFNNAEPPSQVALDSPASTEQHVVKRQHSQLHLLHRQNTSEALPLPAVSAAAEIWDQALNWSRFSRLRVLRFFGTSSRAMPIWELCQFGLSLLSCVFYLVEIYELGPEPLGLILMEGLTASAFFADLLLFTVLSKHKLAHLLSTGTLVDVLGICACLGSLFDNLTLRNLGFIRLLRCNRLWKVLSSRKMNTSGQSHLTLQPNQFVFIRQVSKVVFTLVSFIFCSTGIVYMLELSDEDGELVPFHDCLYFVIITLTTTGYGDIVPHTDITRAVVVMLLLFGIAIIPSQGSKLYRLLRDDGYAKQFRSRKGSPHIVICGHVTNRNILPFLHEFFHEDHGMVVTHVVVVCPVKPSKELKRLLSNAFFQDTLVYIQGSIIDPAIRQLAMLEQASGVFVFVNKQTSEPNDEDGAAVIRALAIKRACPSVPSFAEVIRSERKRHLTAAAVDHVLCINEFKQSIVSLGCLYPGLPAFICNLIRSMDPSQAMLQHHDCPSWLKAYSKGCKHELYSITVPRTIAGLAFRDAARVLRSEFFVLLIALVEDVSGHIILNPHNRILQGGERAFIVAPDAMIADQVSAAINVPRRVLESTHEETETRPVESPPANVPRNERKSRTLRDSIISDASELTNHILVLGLPDRLAAFVRPLRAKQLINNAIPILFLTKKLPKDHDWAQVSRFDEVYIMLGTPVEHESLRRAGAFRSRRVVVLSNPRQVKMDMINLVDCDVILSFLELSAHKAPPPITLELMMPANAALLKSPEDVGRSHLFWSIYAEGGLYESTVEHALLARNFFEHSYFQLIHLLTQSEAGQPSTLVQIVVPESQVGFRFDEVFDAHCSQGVLVMGMFRAHNDGQFNSGQVTFDADASDTRGDHDGINLSIRSPRPSCSSANVNVVGHNATGYVLTNPDSDQIMRAGDLLFVLMPVHG